MARWLIVLGTLSSMMAVGLGAFGAHGLKTRLTPELLTIFETGARYQATQSLGLILVGILVLSYPSSTLHGAGISLGIGVVVFSGSLYILALSGVRIWGAVTPIGGLAFLIGWALFAYSAWRDLG